MVEDLFAAAQAWLDEDPDPDTQAELRGLLDAEDSAGITDRFGARLAFGTAGIRGPLGAGPNRMNRAVVRRVTAGVAAVLGGAAGAEGRSVVVGRDARHKSDVFAEDAARVLAGAGFRVQRFADPVPTPLVAFAVRELGAAAGVVVTASHNPPADNGYKVYWGDGAQITAPLDTEISAAIDAVERLADVPLDDGGVVDVGPDVRAAYLEAALALQTHPGERDLRIVYTPLHGVAGALMLDLLATAGFADVHVVAAQARPDPDFPTVSFPNPEEPGALDRALALAADVEADLLLANDPDGDRIAAAVPGANGWRLLSGDETGCLLAEHRLAQGSGADRVVATTVVSSQLLSRIAEAHGIEYAETLTGFKWLAPVAARAEADGKTFVLAYEQALGVMVGDAVRDKDGISAGLALADLAAGLKAEGRSLLDALDDLAWRHGLHATGGSSVRVEGPTGARVVAEALTRLRANPPAELLGVPVTVVTDYARDLVPTPPTELIVLTLADGSRVQMRPSGTEPLLKFYAEVVEPVAGGQPVAAARERAEQRLAGLLDAFIQLAGCSG
jgi:phosphomannomutase